MAAPRRPPKAPPRIAPCTAPRAGVLCARASANGIIDTSTTRQSKPTVRRIVAPYVVFLVACNAAVAALNVHCTGIALECNDELTSVAASGLSSGPQQNVGLWFTCDRSAILAPSRPVRANQASQRLLFISSCRPAYLQSIRTGRAGRGTQDTAVASTELSGGKRYRGKRARTRAYSRLAEPLPTQCVFVPRRRAN